MKVTEALKDWINTEFAGDLPEDSSDDEYRGIASKAVASGQLGGDKLFELCEIGKKAWEKGGNGSGVTFDDMFGGNGKSPEGYKTTKALGKHAKTGQPMFNEHGRQAMLPSEKNHAMAGAFLKHLANRSGVVSVALTNHERNLRDECFKGNWVGRAGSQWGEYPGEQCKMILDDSTSGGSQVVPEWFDEDIITFPLLSGELFPFIDLRPVPRASAVEAASIGNPTVNWGTSEGTAVNLFDTSTLVAAIDTSIHTITVAVEVGRDFLADSPADVGRVLVENVGQRFAAELDRVTAVGNGTSQPQGIFNASGITTVNSDNGASGPPTLNDYEQLLFAVAKQYRNRAMRPAFISNDTSYQRRTGVKIDTASPTTDQRPVFGMTHNEYMTLGWAHRIQNDIANTKIGYGALSRYRMYRRQGLEVRWEQGGKELALRNTVLLVVRARFGGQLTDASAFAAIEDAQS